MGVMHGTMSADTDVLRKINKFLEDNNWDRTDFKRRLNTDENIADISRDLFELDNDQFNHLKRDWFGDDSQRWWKNLEHPDTLIRPALIEAINAAEPHQTSEPRKSIHIRWDCTPRTTNVITVQVQPKPGTVELLIKTPPPEKEPPY